MYRRLLEPTLRARAAVAPVVALTGPRQSGKTTLVRHAFADAERVTLVRLAAARTGQELSLAELGADVGVSQPTARQWMSALVTGFLVTLLPPHHKNFRKRLRKRSKLHFLDTGLACHLLGITSAAMLESHPLRGAIFESYVVGELTKAFWNRGQDAPLFHWRDASGHEIDIVMDLGNRLVPIETKSGMTVAGDAADTLRWWTALAGQSNTGGVLVHGGVASTQLHGVKVLPWFMTDREA